MKLSKIRKASIEREKKAQTSALFEDDEDLAYRDDFERKLILAKRHFDLAKQAQQSALQNAKICGDHLNEAKRFWKKVSMNRWLKLLKREFPYGGHRNAQNYMQISREWDDRLKSIRKERPNLSIDGALRFLRHGTVEKQKTFDYHDFAVSVEWSQMLKETWRSWPQEVKDWVRSDIEAFRKMMHGLKLDAIRKNAPRISWRKYLSESEIEEMKRRPYLWAIRAMKTYALAYQAGKDSTRPWDEQV